MERARRKALVEGYAQDRPEAGVYRIVNQQNGKALLGATPNLPGTRNRLAFAQSTESVNALDHRLAADAKAQGMGIFRFEVVDTLETGPETTDAELRDDLAELEGLWRERLDPASLY